MRSPIRKSARSSGRFAGRLWIPGMLVTLGACDGSSTGPGNPTAPIELDAYVTADELGGGSGLFTDYCECVSGPVTLVSPGTTPELVECQGNYGVPYSDGQRREVTLIGRGWRVSVEYTVPVDPHLDIRIDATCRDR